MPDNKKKPGWDEIKGGSFAGPTGKFKPAKSGSAKMSDFTRGNYELTRSKPREQRVFERTMVNKNIGPKETKKVLDKAYAKWGGGARGKAVGGVIKRDEPDLNYKAWSEKLKKR